MLAAMAAHIPIGDPLNPSTVVGPVISEAALTRFSNRRYAVKREAGGSSRAASAR